MNKKVLSSDNDLPSINWNLYVCMYQTLDNVPITDHSHSLKVHKNLKKILHIIL